MFYAVMGKIADQENQSFNCIGLCSHVCLSVCMADHYLKVMPTMTVVINNVFS